MRRERSIVRKILLVFGAILICVVIAGLVAISLTPKRPRMQEVKLTDGRIVQLAAVTVGQSHTMHSPRLRNILFAFAPSGLKKQLGPNFSSSFGFQHHGIALWLMCYDPVTKQYVPNALNKLVIVDEHGCELENGTYGVTADGYHFAEVMHVENFPRDRETLTFRMLNTMAGTNALGEITIQNPARRQRENWTSQTLPIMATNGTVTARLNRIAPVMRANEDVELFENGAPTQDWALDEMHYADPLGNFGHNLCRKQPAWKLKMRFMRSPRAEFGGTEVWKAGSVTVPQTGKFSSFGLSNTVAGVPLTLRSFCGSGLFSFANGVCVAGSPWTNGMSSQFSVTSARKRGENIPITTRAAYNPVLVVEHDSLYPERQFLARFRHEGNVIASAQGANGDGKSYYYDLSWQVPPEEIPTNAPLEMEIIIQKGIEFEFLVNPKDYERPRKPL